MNTTQTYYPSVDENFGISVCPYCAQTSEDCACVFPNKEDVVEEIDKVKLKEIKTLNVKKQIQDKLEEIIALVKQL